MFASPSGKCAAARRPSHGSNKHDRSHGGENANQGPAQHISAQVPAGMMQPVPSAATNGDASMVGNEQCDPDLHGEAAVQHLGSFGAWYERTLAAMTNLQKLRNGPLAADRGAVGGGARSTAGPITKSRTQALAEHEGHSLTQMLLPDPTHMDPFTGVHSSIRTPGQSSCPLAACSGLH